MSDLHHPRMAARPRGARATRWWGKAWVRAVEESAYAERDLGDARTLARSGRVGQISTGAGHFNASVEDDRGVWDVLGAVPVLDDAGLSGLVESIAADPGRITGLLAGDLQHDLVEHAEEAGVELLPYGSELATSCTCDGWVDPCVHGLAVLHQLGWLLEDDPFVLLQLRGLPRDDLLARLHASRPAPDAPDGGHIEDSDGSGDLEAGLEAALRAQRLLAELADAEAETHRLF